MSNQTLATKWRPKDWDSLVEQSYIKTILENQIETNSIKNTYLFVGSAGTGKTTSARIFANKINEGKGNPIEVDGASNNGIDQVRTIIEDAKFKPLDSKYKVYIIDECHAISNAGWQALLKLLEEPPKTTIFILCTTELNKVPDTIKSRCQIFTFNKISQEGIVSRLKYIIKQENLDCVDEYYIDYQEEALNYISKVSEGGMRTAISNMEKCLGYSNNLTIENVVKALGISDYENLDRLLTNILNKDATQSIAVIENIYSQGKDLKLFVKQFIQFVLDASKYQIYNSYEYIQIPNTIDIKAYAYYEYNNLLVVLDEIIELSNQIKYEQNPKVLIESKILLLCRGE